MCIEDFEEGKQYKMPWWGDAAYITRIEEVFTIHHFNRESKEIDFNSAQHFKICEEYVEVESNGQF